jgi:hypothetical protein
VVEAALEALTPLRLEAVREAAERLQTQRALMNPIGNGVPATLDARREAAQAYIASQQHQGWLALPQRYDDGGFSGGNLDLELRPCLAPS